MALSEGTPRWAERIVRSVRKGGTLVLIHFDPFLEPLEDGPSMERPDEGPLSPGVPPLGEVVAAIRQARPDVTVVIPRPFSPVRVRLSR